jgi:uncharacterized protein (DUF1810 family)
MQMNRANQDTENIVDIQEANEQKNRNWRHYGQHIHGLPCSADCTIYGVDEPVDGDIWMLQRFVDAQNSKGTYERALSELRQVKTTDWIWYVFPQLWGLAKNFTPASLRYGLRGRKEAQAYVAHPLLYPRLVQATQVLLGNERPLEVIMPKEIDRIKLRSSMTLFREVADASDVFATALERFFNGEGDRKTLNLLLGLTPPEGI